MIKARNCEWLCPTCGKIEPNLGREPAPFIRSQASTENAKSIKLDFKSCKPMVDKQKTRLDIIIVEQATRALTILNVDAIHRQHIIDVLKTEVVEVLRPPTTYQADYVFDIIWILLSKLKSDINVKGQLIKAADPILNQAIDSELVKSRVIGNTNGQQTQVASYFETLYKRQIIAKRKESAVIAPSPAVLELKSKKFKITGRLAKIISRRKNLQE